MGNYKTSFIFNKGVSNVHYSKTNRYTYATYATYAPFSNLNSNLNSKYNQIYPTQYPNYIYYRSMQPSTIFATRCPSILPPTNTSRLIEPSNKYDINTIIIISLTTSGVTIFLFIIIILYRYKYFICQKIKWLKFRCEENFINDLETESDLASEVDLNPEFGIRYSEEY